MKLTVALLLLFLTLVPLTAPADMISGLAAVVNGEVITTYELGKETALLVREAEKKGPLDEQAKAKLRSTALNQLIDKKLVDQKINELGVRVSEEEVRQAIEDVKKQNSLTQEALVAALANQGLSFDQYRAQLKEQLERLRLVSQEVRAKVQVSDREIQEYYDANPARFSEDERFKARHILFRIEKTATAEDIKRVMTKAMTVLYEAKGGADFAALARTYSDDPAAAKDGGELGTFSKGDMIPEIEESVITMQPGQISDLVKSPAGFHIIKLEERFPGKLKSLESAKGAIEELLYRKKSEERFSQWVADLRKDSSIEIK